MLYLQFCCHNIHSFLLHVIMLNVIRVSVIILNVVAPILTLDLIVVRQKKLYRGPLFYYTKCRCCKTFLKPLLMRPQNKLASLSTTSVYKLLGAVVLVCSSKVRGIISPH